MLITFAIIGIKFTLSETMPKKQIVTALDSYINNSLVFLAAVGFYHMVIGYLSNQVRCHWWLLLLVVVVGAAGGAG